MMKNTPTLIEKIEALKYTPEYNKIDEKKVRRHVNDALTKAIMLVEKECPTAHSSRPLRPNPPALQPHHLRMTKHEMAAKIKAKGLPLGPDTLVLFSVMWEALVPYLDLPNTQVVSVD